MLELEYDNAPLGDVDRMGEERRARVKETMGDLLRHRRVEVPRRVADEVNFIAPAEASPYDMQRFESRKHGRIAEVVKKVASLAVVDDPGLQTTYAGLAAAINAHLDEYYEGFDVGVNEMEKAVTSVVASKRE